MTSVEIVATWTWSCPACLTAYVSRNPPETHTCVNPNCGAKYALGLPKVAVHSPE